MNKTQIQRTLRRILEMRWTRTTQRRLFLIGCGVCVLILYLFLWFLSPVTINLLNKCTMDQFDRFSSVNLGTPASQYLVSFAGNGFIGIDVALDQQLLVSWFNGSSVVAPIYTDFRPLVELTVLFQSDEKFQFVSDYRKGVSRGVKCFVMLEKCVCLYQMIYAHRTRSNLLVHEVHISNPTASTIELSFKRKGNPSWEQSISGSLPVYLKNFGDNEKIVVAIVCSSVPLNKISVKPQTEENFRFLCIVENGLITLNDNESILKRMLSHRATDSFSILNSLNSNTLDFEHYDAWNTLNRAEFNISHSKASNSLNIDTINLTRYALLSAVRAPLIEIPLKSLEQTNKLQSALEKTELCYSGHSTLLTPSKLWQEWTSIHELLRTVEIWLMTLEHRGCVHMLSAGTHGVAQAFLLSLLAATFTHHRLETALDPESDLHRHIRVENLRVGSVDLALNFDLNEYNKPFAEVHINSKVNKEFSGNLYACSAGCLDKPEIIKSMPVRFAVKMTKPATPILFIAESQEHLIQIKNTLHVVEVMDAPAPESHKIDLHKHGDSTGLPMIFWVILIFLLIVFHGFLFKILYTEWNNSSTISYSKFNKRLVLRRS